MRRRTPSILPFAAAVLAAALAGCGSDGATEPEPLPPLAITGDFIVVPDTSLLVVGMGRRLGVEELSGLNAAFGSAPWTSSDPSVATVSGDGYVMAVGEGSALISVTLGGRTAAAPVRVQRYPAPLRFTQVSTGETHACGLTTDGAMYCWGYGDVGQLGTTRSLDACESLYIGSSGPNRSLRRCSAVPVRVESGVTFSTVAAWYGGTCALDRDGVLYCWGQTQLVPRQTGGTLRFAAITQRCGVSVAGDGYCWGDNTSGALGTGSTLPASTSSDAPVLVSGGLKWKSLDAGEIARCGVATDGGVYCWGDNFYRQLGIGSAPSDPGCFLSVCKLAPTRVASSALFATVSVGATDVCALTPDGEAYCWGSTYGALPTSAGAARFSSIAVGALSTCGISRDGKTLCWGSATGPGSPIPASSTPVEAALPTAMRSISKVFSIRACGIGTDDLLYCWGYPDALRGAGELRPPGQNNATTSGDPTFGAVVGQR